MMTVPITITPEKSLLIDPDPALSSPCCDPSCDHETLKGTENSWMEGLYIPYTDTILKQLNNSKSSTVSESDFQIEIDIAEVDKTFIMFFLILFIALIIVSQ